MKKNCCIVFLFLLLSAEIRPFPLAGVEFLLGGLLVMIVRSSRVQSYDLGRFSCINWDKKIIVRTRSMVLDRIRDRVRRSSGASMISIQSAKLNRLFDFTQWKDRRAESYERNPLNHIKKKKAAEDSNDFYLNLNSYFKSPRVSGHTSYTQSTQHNMTAMGLYQKFIQGIDPELYTQTKARLISIQNERYKYWFQGFLGGVTFLTLRDWLLKKEEKDQCIHVHISSPARATCPVFVNPEQYRHLS